MNEPCEAYLLDEPNSKRRVPHNFEFSLIYHLIECFDIPDAIELLSEIMKSVGNHGRDTGYCITIYFGGFKNFRRLLIHHACVILRKQRNMSISNIATKFGTSSREVYRGIRCPGSNR